MTVVSAVLRLFKLPLYREIINGRHNVVVAARVPALWAALTRYAGLPAWRVGCGDRRGLRRGIGCAELTMYRLGDNNSGVSGGVEPLWRYGYVVSPQPCVI